MIASSVGALKKFWIVEMTALYEIDWCTEQFAD